eukprot:31303-Pelagococcus_subviridis.AAC.21
MPFSDIRRNVPTICVSGNGLSWRPKHHPTPFDRDAPRLRGVLAPLQDLLRPVHPNRVVREPSLELLPSVAPTPRVPGVVRERNPRPPRETVVRVVFRVVQDKVDRELSANHELVQEDVHTSRVPRVASFDLERAARDVHHADLPVVDVRR